MNGMSTIVKTITRWVTGFIFLYGIYIVVYGHLTPGGGFAGGVILACPFVLLVLADGKQQAMHNFPFRVSGVLDSIGALVFLTLALLGLASTGGAFFLNFIQKQTPGVPGRLFNAGIIPLANIAIGLKVCASLFLAMVLLSVLRVTAGGTEADLVSEEDQ